MGETTRRDVLDSDGEFFHEEGLTFKDLLVGDLFRVGDFRCKKLTDNTASKLGLGPDSGGFGTFLPSQPVTRYGNFTPFSPGFYVTRLPADPQGTYQTPTFARLAIGDVFTPTEDFSVYYRKLTSTKAVRLNPFSPLLKKALKIGGVS